MRVPLPFLLPLLAILFVVVWGGGVGLTFILLATTSAGVWGAVFVGMGIVVLVPSLAALITLPGRGSSG